MQPNHNFTPGHSEGLGQFFQCSGSYQENINYNKMMACHEEKNFWLGKILVIEVLGVTTISSIVSQSAWNA